ncbi:unnamed protein product, partial [Medioppia subpectinata]
LSVKPCYDGWAYDTTFYEQTAVTALDLVCDQSHYVNMILSVGNFGTIIGTPFFGWLSDNINLIQNRKKKDFSKSVGARSRTYLNGIACLAWVGGLCTLPLIAYLTRHWVTLNIVTSITIIPYFFCWKLLPESPRWLIINEKYAEAEKQLLDMAATNGKPAPKDLIHKLKSVGKSLNADDSEKVNNAFLLFVKKPGLRRNVSLVTLNWMCCAAVYFGIHLNLYNFSGNEFLNFFLLSAIEFPAYLFGWYLIGTRMGRRWSLSAFVIFCGFSLCVPSVVPEEYAFVTNIMAMAGKFCTTLAFMVVYQQGAELYPTPIRNQGLGIGSMASSVVGIFMPYLIF